MDRAQRVSSHEPCVICGGHDRIPQGQGRRCHGYRSSDGTHAYCSRGELAGALHQQGESSCYPHRLHGPCACGVTHGASVVEIGSAASARIVATYDYRDERGRLVYQVVRKEPKTFRQRRPDGAGGWLWDLSGVTPLVYHLPEVIAAVAARDGVWIAEGEKDVDALRSLGLVATCNSGGAGKWPAAMAPHFVGADVTLVRDRDDPGHQHARDVYAKLRRVVRSFRVVEPLAGKDVSEHLDAGKTLAELVPVWPLEDLRHRDVAAWRVAVIRTVGQAEDACRRVRLEEALALDPDPRYPTGLIGGGGDILHALHGVTLVHGAPSAAKSIFATGAAIQAAYAGWRVLYLVAEMGDRPMAERVERHLRGGAPPPGFHLISVERGSVELLTELTCDGMDHRPTLVVPDSLSSFVDGAIAADSEDIHGLGALRATIMWCVNVKRRTHGQVAFLLLSEQNSRGEAKGRTGAHKADLTISMESDEKEPSVKLIRVQKGWETRTGLVGRYQLEYGTASLRRLP